MKKPNCLPLSLEAVPESYRLINPIINMQSPLKQLVTFTGQTAGLEKTLRLIQAVSQIVGVTSDDKTLSTQCLAARDQLALGCTLPVITYLVFRLKG